MAVLTGITGAVRAGIAGYANKSIKASAKAIKNISRLPLEGNNANVDDFGELYSPKTTTILTYPIDVDSNAQQGHYILFEINKRIPLGRMAYSDEIQGILIWTLSDAASYLNGAIIPVDGGRSSW